MPRYRYNMMDDRRNGNCQNRNTQANCVCMANESQTRSTDCGCMTNENQSRSTNCGCMTNDNSSQKMVLAMAYVPWQRWGNLYDLDQALMAGTIFADLNKPFRGTGGCCNGR